MFLSSSLCPRVLSGVTKFLEDHLQEDISVKLKASAGSNRYLLTPQVQGLDSPAQDM